MTTAGQPLGAQTSREAHVQRRTPSLSADRPVISAEEAFRLLDIDRSTGYKAIREGTFPVPVVRIGRLIRVPTVALNRLLNLHELDTEGTEQ